MTALEDCAITRAAHGSHATDDLAPQSRRIPAPHEQHSHSHLM
jgi:hypothetical protein